MPHGERYGGRKALTEAGPAVIKAFRLSRETVEALAEAAARTGEAEAEIARRAIDRELERLRRLDERAKTKRTGRPAR